MLDVFVRVLSAVSLITADAAAADVAADAAAAAALVGARVDLLVLLCGLSLEDWESIRLRKWG